MTLLNLLMETIEADRQTVLAAHRPIARDPRLVQRDGTGTARTRAEATALCAASVGSARRRPRSAIPAGDRARYAGPVRRFAAVPKVLWRRATSGGVISLAGNINFLAQIIKRADGGWTT